MIRLTHLIGVMAGILSSTVHGQVPKSIGTAPIGDAIRCQSRAIEERFSSVLRLPNSLQMAKLPTAIRQDRLGRIWVFESEAIQVCNADGSFLKSVGRRGSGSGEYLLPNNMFVVPSDSVVTIDTRKNGATVLSAKLEYVRSIVFALQAEYVQVLHWPDSVVMTGESSTPLSVGWPLNLVSFSGKQAQIVKSFGPGSGDLRPGQGSRLPHALSTSSAGAFLSAEALSYDLYAWSDKGALVRHWARRPQWFSGSSRLALGGATKPPASGLTGVWVENSRTYWLVSRVPSSHWNKGRLELNTSSLSLTQRCLFHQFDYVTTFEIDAIPKTQFLALTETTDRSRP